MARYVVIGGVAGGMSAAARLRRLAPSASITVVEEGAEVSFANCGLPYHVSGEIPSRDSLLLHTPATLRATLGLDVRPNTQATRVDPAARTVTIYTPTGDEQLSYDALVLSPGGYTVRPLIEGIEHPLVRTLRSVPDADAIRRLVVAGARRAVVLGAGFIGLEAVEALRTANLDVALVEAAEHVLPVVDAEIAAYVRDELQAHKVAVHEGTTAERIEARGDALALRLADGAVLDVDLVVVSAGVRPRSDLAATAGLALTDTGAILVDEYQRTSDPHIWAVGDATASVHAVTGAVAPIALATPANRAGRVAADSIAAREQAGGDGGTGRPSPPPLGTAVVRVFEITVAMTGAPRNAFAGRTVHTARVHAGHHAGYFPGAQTMHLLLHFDEEGRILGAQGAGGAGVDKRIDVVATAMRAGLRAADLVDLDLCYAPPFGSAKDPVMVLGMIADNVRRGLLCQHDPIEGLDFEASLVVDVRSVQEWQRGHLPGALLVPQPQVADCIDAIRDAAGGRPIVLHCASGFRSYLAHRTLAAHGVQSSSVSGGLNTLVAAHPDLSLATGR